MPGIVGLITKAPREYAMPQLMRMVEALRHEPSYSTGTWADEASGVYVGWVARQGAFAEAMPLQNENGNLVLVLSGEEYPDPNTASRLKRQGHDFKPEGPSYLVHLAEEDAFFPATLNGRFHGLLIDRKAGTASLFNDRYGMQRVYYHQAGDTFYFAAEAKAILAVRPELRSLDPAGLGEFVSCGAVLEDRTLFARIYLLPVGSAWRFRRGVIENKGTYFDPKEWEDQGALDIESYYHQLREVYTRNLPRYFKGDQAIAMSLTGGLDTRMVLAWHRSDPGSLPCYTFGSMFRENHDVRVARRVAKACGQPHQVIPAGSVFLSRFAHFAERSIYLTDGCVDVGRAPDLYLNEIARQIAPVRMTGVYGGEVLRRVRSFKPSVPAPGLFCPDFLPYLSQTSETFAQAFRGHPVSFAAFRQGPWFHYGSLALEQTQLAMRTPFLDNDFVRTVFRSPLSALSGNEISLRLISDGNPELGRIPTDRGLGGNHGHFMATLSKGLLEFQFKAEYAYDMGMPQWLARADHALARLHFQRLFLGRHKVFHFRVWYRDSLASYVQEMLLDPLSLSRPYIERKGLEAVVRGHVNGDQNYTTEIHKALTLEILHRLFVDNAAQADAARATDPDQLTVACRPLGGLTEFPELPDDCARG